MTRNVAVIGTLVLLGSLVLALSCSRLDAPPAAAESGSAAGAKAGPGGESAAAVLVRLGSFELGEISATLSVPADLEAVEEADVYSEVTGIIRTIRRWEGDRVAAGEAIVLLADDELRLATETEEIQLGEARTKADLAVVQRREAEVMVKQKEALFDRARREYERTEKLFREEEGIISPEDREAKLYAMKQAEADLESARLSVERLRLEESQAAENVRLAAKELEVASYKQTRAVIRSPIDGYLSFLDHKVGELVGPSTLLFSAVNLERLRARLHVPQRELRRVQVGQRVAIRSEVYPECDFAGDVLVINPVIDKATGTVQVTVGVLDPLGTCRESAAPYAARPAGGPRLRPGMFVDAEIITETRNDALLVTKKAVLYENREPVIFLVENGTARRCVLTPGLTTADRIEVKALRRGDAGAGSGEPLDLSLRKVLDGGRVELASGRLVLVGQNRLKDGSAVEIEAPSPQAAGG